MCFTPIYHFFSKVPPPALINAYRFTLEMFAEMYVPRRHESVLFTPI